LHASSIHKSCYQCIQCCCNTHQHQPVPVKQIQGHSIPYWARHRAHANASPMRWTVVVGMRMLQSLCRRFRLHHASLALWPLWSPPHRVCAGAQGAKHVQCIHMQCISLPAELLQQVVSSRAQHTCACMTVTLCHAGPFHQPGRNMQRCYQPTAATSTIS
jgi:hypothetical protein